MPQRITKKNQETGEIFSFDWNGSKAPTSDDIDRMYKERNEAKMAALDKMKAQQAPWYDRALASQPGQVALGVAERLGLPRTWEPGKDIGDIVSGVGQMANYWHPNSPPISADGKSVAHPQIAGFNKAARGAMNLTAPFATAAGYVLPGLGAAQRAPNIIRAGWELAKGAVPAAGAFLGGGLAQEEVPKLLPEDTSPEVKEAVGTGAGLLTGAGVGYLAMPPGSATAAPVGPRPQAGVFREMPPGPPPPPPPPPGWDVRGQGFNRPTAIEPPAPRQIAPPEPARIGGPPPPPPPPGAPPGAPPPPPGLPPGPNIRGLLPQEGGAIPLPPASIPMPPAGTFEGQQAAQQRVAWGEENLAPMGRRQLPPPGYEAPPRPTQDIVSAKPEPLSPSDVSSVSAVEETPVSPAEGPPSPIPAGRGGVPVVAPPVTGPVSLPGPVAPLESATGVTPGNAPGITPEVLPAVQPPAVPTTAGPVTIEAQQPQPIRPPLAPPLRSPAQPPAPAPVAPPVPPPPAPPPPAAATAEVTGPPKAPPASGIAAAAMRKAYARPAAPVKTLPEVKAPEAPKAEAPPEDKYLRADNHAPELSKKLSAIFKDNPNPTPEQMATELVKTDTDGYTFDQYKTYAKEVLDKWEADTKKADQNFKELQAKETSAPPAPVESAQIEAPSEKPKSIAARAIEAAKKNRVIPPGFPEVKAPEPAPLPKVEPPKEVKEVKAREEVKIEPKDEPIPETPQEESELAPSTRKTVQSTNQVLDLLKRRKDVRISDLQTNLGLTVDESLNILKELQKRGLANGKLGKWNYARAPGEQPFVPKAPGPVAPPVTAKGAEVAKTPGPVAPPVEKAKPVETKAVETKPVETKEVEAPKKEIDQISTGGRNPKFHKALQEIVKKYPSANPEQVGEFMYYKFLNSGYSKGAYADFAAGIMGRERSNVPVAPSPAAPSAPELPKEVKSTALPEKVLNRLKEDSEVNETAREEIRKAEPKVEGARGKRIETLKQQIEDAKAEGDNPKIFEQNLESEMKNAQIEKSGSKKAKSIVVEMDEVFKKIEELEAKQEKLALNNDEQSQYDALAKRYGKLEHDRDFEIKPEKEKYGDYAGGLRDLHSEAAAQGYKGKESHKFLTDKAIEGGFIKKSLKEFEADLPGMRKFEDSLKTEGLEREQEIADLESEQLEGELSPKKASRLKQLWTDETGTSDMKTGLKNLTELFDPAVKDWTQSGETTLEKEGAQKLYERVRRARTEGGMKAGDLVADYKDNIRNLSTKEAENMLKVLRGEGRAMNQKVARAAQAENVRFQKTLQAMEDGKLETNIDPLDSTRTDKAVLSDFYDAAGKKLGEFEQLGPRTKPPKHMREGAGMVGGIPEDVHSYIEQVRKKGGDWRGLYDVLDPYFNPNKMSAAGQRLWDKFAAAQVITKLSNAVISNATQLSNTAIVAGNWTTTKAFIKMMADYKGARDFSLRSGSTLSSVTHESAMNAGAMPKGWSSRMLQMTGFAPVEVFNRTLATMTGVEHAGKMFERLKKNPSDAMARRHLSKWLGLDPETLLKQSELTIEQKKIAGASLADRTQFRTTPLEIPPAWGSSGLGKTLTLFKNFGFNQAKFMVKDIIMKELGKGNMRPLIPLFTTVPALGFLAHNMKNFVVGKKQAEKYWRWIIDIYSAGSGAGILQDMAMSSAYGNVAGFLGGTLAGDTADALESAWKSGEQKSLKPIAKEVVKRIPIVGRPIVGHSKYFQPRQAAGAKPWGSL